LRRGVKTLLDVGTGDGIRAHRIATAAQIEYLVLADPNPNMLALAQQTPANEYHLLSAEELSQLQNQRFNAITCLWNVLGHISPQINRLISLRNIYKLLEPDGTFIFDINNRYNAAAYGWKTVLKNIKADMVKPGETNGDVTYNLDVDNVSIPAMGHVFSPREINSLLRKTGFFIRKTQVIDYKTGEPKKSLFAGQLLYEVEKR